MTTLPYNPEQTDELIAHLNTKLPAYQVRKRFGNILVRTSGFTLTGNVTVKPSKRSKNLKLTTNYDMRVLYWFMSWPVAIYITVKKDKQLAMEKEVATYITEFTENELTIIK